MRKLFHFTMVMVVIIGTVITLSILERRDDVKASTVTYPDFKFPWSSTDNPWYFTGGPHKLSDNNSGNCNEYPLGVLSGLDFNKTEWSPVVAMAGGVVSYANYRDDGLGYSVIIDHVSHKTLYAHLQIDFEVVVGQTISQGAHLGYIGWSGGSLSQSEAHLHVELLDSSGNPVSWDGVVIDGWTLRSIRKETDLTLGFNYQGTLVKGSEGGLSRGYNCGNRTVPASVITGSSGTKYSDIQQLSGFNDLNSSNVGYCAYSGQAALPSGIEGNCTPPTPTPGPLPTAGATATNAPPTSTLVPVPTQTPSPQTLPEVGVSLCTYINLAGVCQTYIDEVPVLDPVMDGQASSLKVPVGWEVDVWRMPYYTNDLGNRNFTSGSYPDLSLYTDSFGSWRNRIRSLRPWCLRNGISFGAVLYNRSYMHGACESFQSDDSNLSDNSVIKNNSTVSVRVANNIQLTLCSEINYGGVCTEYVTNMTDIGNPNTAKSVRVRYIGPSPTPLILPTSLPTSTNTPRPSSSPEVYTLTPGRPSPTPSFLSVTPTRTNTPTLVGSTATRTATRPSPTSMFPSSTPTVTKTLTPTVTSTLTKTSTSTGTRTVTLVVSSTPTPTRTSTRTATVGGTSIIHPTLPPVTSVSVSRTPNFMTPIPITGTVTVTIFRIPPPTPAGTGTVYGIKGR